MMMKKVTMAMAMVGIGVGLILGLLLARPADATTTKTPSESAGTFTTNRNIYILGEDGGFWYTSVDPGGGNTDVTTGNGTTANPFDTTLAIARMCFAGLLREFPNIRWIVAHAGGAVPYLMERLDTGYRDFAECRENIDEPPSAYLRRLYYDTVTFNPHVLRLVRDAVGADHMTMGSDYPHKLGDIERAVSSIDAFASSSVEKERIFSGTALAILNNV